MQTNAERVRLKEKKYLIDSLKILEIRERRRVLAGIPRWILAFCLLV